jgi:hypothetical protein
MTRKTHPSQMSKAARSFVVTVIVEPANSRCMFLLHNSKVAVNPQSYHAYHVRLRTRSWYVRTVDVDI